MMSGMMVTNLPLFFTQLLSHHDGKWPTCCTFLAKMELMFHSMGSICRENTVINEICDAGSVVNNHEPLVYDRDICKRDIKPRGIICIANDLKVRFHHRWKV
jgi:hypothetical protein